MGPILLSHSAVKFFFHYTVFVVIGAQDGLGGLGGADCHVSFGEDSVGDAVVEELALDDFDEGRAEAEFDFAAGAELLSVFEVSFVKRTLLEKDTTPTELTM